MTQAIDPRTEKMVYTLSEAAIALSVRESAVRQFIREGQLIAFKLDLFPCISKSMLDRFIERQEALGEAEADIARFRCPPAIKARIPIPEEFLEDVKKVFLQRNREHREDSLEAVVLSADPKTCKVRSLATRELIDALSADETGPWATCNQGQPISARQVSAYLARFGIETKTVRTARGTCKGVSLEQLLPVFDRCLPWIKTEAQGHDPLQRREYRRRIASKEWDQFRRGKIIQAGFVCGRCGLLRPGTFTGFELHHKTYERLGHERDDDFVVLCRQCHQQADGERSVAAQRRVYDARLDGWASKVYGEEWVMHEDVEGAAEQFEEWLERRGDAYD